jgi:hypothetical protein
VLTASRALEEQDNLVAHESDVVGFDVHFFV